jgi:hypothetical protein
MVCDKFHISENFTFRMTLNEAKRGPVAAGVVYRQGGFQPRQQEL